MSTALTLVRVLRHLPRTGSFDRHLTDCAALEVFYQTAPLTWRHILKLDALPSFIPQQCAECDCGGKLCNWFVPSNARPH